MCSSYEGETLHVGQFCTKPGGIRVYHPCLNGRDISAHLEIIAWSQQPCVLFFLDFEKAFDRLDRPWLRRCMAATGFGGGAQRWVSLMHASTSAKSPSTAGTHRDFLPLLLFWEGTPRGCWCWTCKASSSPKRNGRCACIATLHQLSWPHTGPVPSCCPSHALCEPACMPEPSATPLRWPAGASAA